MFVVISRYLVYGHFSFNARKAENLSKHEKFFTTDYTDGHGFHFAEHALKKVAAEVRRRIPLANVAETVRLVTSAGTRSVLIREIRGCLRYHGLASVPRPSRVAA